MVHCRIYEEYGLFSGGMKDGVDLEFITMFETNLKIPRNVIPGFAKHCLYLNELEMLRKEVMMSQEVNLFSLPSNQYDYETSRYKEYFLSLIYLYK